MKQGGDLVALLLGSRHPRVECAAPGEWLPVWRAVQSAHAEAEPFAAAVACALEADRVAWAFFSGYQGAVQAAFRTEVGSLGAFCANEAQRKITEIETALGEQDSRLLVRGSKSWVLAGIDDLMLFVLARCDKGPTKGPGSLVVVQLPIRGAGVERERPRAQEVVPELPHCAIRFELAPLAASDVLPGDGYSDHAKPFRLREDVFVTGCVLAYLFAESQAGPWSTQWNQRAIAALSMLEACSRRDPREVDTIILVAGALSLAGDLIREAEAQWAPHQQAARDRWLRDKPILALGKDARRQRAIKSWQVVGRESA